MACTAWTMDFPNAPPSGSNTKFLSDASEADVFNRDEHTTYPKKGNMEERELETPFATVEVLKGEV